MQIIHFKTGPVSVNTYIIYNETTLKGFIIDPGGNFKRIIKEISDKGITLEAQLLTHGHFDHCGAGKQLQDMGIPVYIHKADADKLCTSGNLSDYFKVEFERFTTDKQLSDGDKLVIAGFNITVLHTPGHTSGCVCYILDNNIFTGDTLFNMSVGRTDFPDGSSGKLNDSIQNKLFKLEGDYNLYPGHDDFTTLDYERNYNPYIEYGLK